MKTCYKCNVKINTNVEECPLCHNILEEKNKGENIFPTIESKYQLREILEKILKFLAISSVFISIFLNYVISKEISWSLFVVAGITSFFITLNITLKTRKNFMKLLFAEFNIILFSSILWDIFTGFYKWSLNYVLPLTCISYIVAIFIMRIFFKYYIKDYVFYIVTSCLIGLSPIILLIFNVLTVRWISYISVCISIFVIALMYVFNKKSLQKELERRLHF